MAADNSSFVEPVKRVKSGFSKKKAAGEVDNKDGGLSSDRQGAVDLIQEVYRKRTKIGFVVGEISGKTTERGGTAVFVVYLQSRPTADVTLSIKSENEKEGKVNPGKAVFTPENWSERQTITVIGQDDRVMDGEQVYDIIVSPSSEADFEYSRLASKSIAVRNKDDDKSGFIVSKISGSTSEKGDRATFSIKLNSQPTAPVLVYVYSSDESEGQVESQKVLFTEKDWNKERLVTVVGQDDRVEDEAQAYAIILDPAISDDENYNGLKLGKVEVINRDNDRVGIIASKVKGDTGEDGVATIFNVRLRSEPIAKVEILVSSLNLDEGFVKPETLIFTPKNWNKNQQVKVIGRDDSVDDGDQKYNVRLSPRSGGDPKYDRLKSIKVSVVNKDNDKVGVSVAKIIKKTSEIGGEAKFSVKLDTEPMADVKFGLRSSNEREGRIILNELVFTPDDWYVAKTIKVIGVDDELADGNQIYRIIISAAESRDPKYHGMDPLDPNFVNLDNDSIGFTIGDAKGKTSEDGGTASFDIRIDSKPKADVIVYFTSSDSSEGVPQVNSVTFTPYNWDDPQTVSVIGQPDQEVDGDQEYFIITSVESEDPDYKQLNPKDVSVVNIDKNGYSIFVGKVEGDTTEEGGGVILPVRLNSKPNGRAYVDIAVSDPGEGKADPSRLFFDAQNWNRIQKAKIIGVDDDVQDGVQSYHVVLDPGSETDNRFQRAPSVKIDLNNLDDDKAGLVIDVVDGTADEDGGISKFAIRLSSQPTSSVVLIFNTDNPAESQIMDYHAEFSPDNWDENRVIRAKGLSDNKVDGDQTFHVVSQGAVSKDPNYNQLPFSKIKMLNRDLDSPKFNISDINGDTDETGGKAAFKVSLSSIPKYEVTLNYASDDETEGLVKPDQLTFSPKNWNKEQIVSVIGVDDGYKDYDQDYKIIFSSSKSEDTDYQGLSSNSVSVTNFDSKRWSLGVAASQFYMLEGLGKEIQNIGSYGLQAGYMFTRIIELDVFILQAGGNTSEYIYDDNKGNSYDYTMEYTLDIMSLSLGSKFFLVKSFVDPYVKAGFDLYSWKLTAVNKLDDSAVTNGRVNLGTFIGAVILESKKSLAEAWYKATKRMIDKYGEPNQIVLPSAINNLDEFVNKHFFSNFTVFDLEIKNGNWKPLAKWIYTNNVVISVEVVSNFKKWRARWRFFHVDLAKSAQVKLEKIKPDDF